MPIAAAITATGIGGALITSSAAKKAAGIQKEAADDATAFQKEALETTRTDLAPYRGTGESALYTLADFYGLDREGGGQTGQALSQESLDAFKRSPDYQFALQEGISSLDRTAAAKGLLLSGKQYKDVVGYAEGLASTNLGGYLDRLYQLAGVGGNAAARTSQAALETGRGMANTALAGGEAAASGVIGSANAINRGLGDVVSNLTTYNYMRNPSSYVSNSTVLY